MENNNFFHKSEKKGYKIVDNWWFLIETALPGSSLVVDRQGVLQKSINMCAINRVNVFPQVPSPRKSSTHIVHCS